MLENEKEIVRNISSDLIRAQRQENKDLKKKNQYLERAANESVKIANYYLKNNNHKKSIEYFLTAANSYEKSNALFQSKSCYKKLLDIYNEDKTEFYDYYEKSKEGLSRIKKIIEEDFLDFFNLEKKEGRVSATDFLIWKNNGTDTNELVDQYEKNFHRSINDGTIRNYSRELENRKRVIIWGGPQGRPYHIYPNLMNLATRKDHYNNKTLIEGVMQNRLTNKFEINSNKWYSNKEIFEVNGVNPSLLLTVDMDAFVRNIDKFREGLQVKAYGELNKPSELSEIGYTTNNNQFDILDSQLLIDYDTGEKIYGEINVGG